jgi:hypothetical protein
MKAIMSPGTFRMTTADDDMISSALTTEVKLARLDTVDDGDEDSQDSDDSSEDGSKKDEFDEDGRDELKDLAALTELESKILGDDDDKEADFDTLWDTVECDNATAELFELKKRDKERAKERAKEREKKQKEKKQTTKKPRLRLFEKKKKQEEELKKSMRWGSKSSNSNGYGNRKKNGTSLSDEFLDAITKVFDDESDVSLSDKGESAGEDSLNAELNTSMRSVYMHHAVSTEETEEKENDGDGDGTGSVKSGTSKNSKTRRGRRRPPGSSRKNKGKPKLKSSRRRYRLNADPGAMFEAEFQKQKEKKELTISNLKQEMTDRRGATAKLVEREFTAELKRKITHGSANDVSSANLFATRNDNEETDKKTDQKPKAGAGDIGDLDAHLARSRWHDYKGDANEDLNSLVQLSTKEMLANIASTVVGGATSAAAFATTQATQAAHMTAGGVMNAAHMTAGGVMNAAHTAHTTADSAAAHIPAMPAMPTMQPTTDSRWSAFSKGTSIGNFTFASKRPGTNMGNLDEEPEPEDDPALNMFGATTSAGASNDFDDFENETSLLSGVEASPQRGGGAAKSPSRFRKSGVGGARMQMLSKFKSKRGPGLGMDLDDDDDPGRGGLLG